MSDSKDDEAKFNETLKRMLETPPKPHRASETESAQKKPGDTSGKKRRPEDG